SLTQTATTDTYPLSLHDALPICRHSTRPIIKGENLTMVNDGWSAVLFISYKLLTRPMPIRSARANNLAGQQIADFRRCLPLAHRSEEHTSELQSRENLVCRLLLE